MILYKKDNAGRIRYVDIYSKGNLLIQKSGIVGTENPLEQETVCSGKNIGRANETSDEQQATAEADALIAIKLKRNYFKTPEETAGKEFRPMKGLVWADQKKKPDFPLLGSYKMDGACAYAFHDGEQVILNSFTGEEWVSCPHINSTLEKFFEAHPNIILHGELYNHEYAGRFNELMSTVRQTKPKQEDLDKARALISLYVHDMFDQDFPETAAFHRYGFLEKHPILAETAYIIVSPQEYAKSQAEADLFHKAAVAQQYEGTVWRPNVAYTPNQKAKGFFKRKDYQDAEFELIRFEEGKGNWAGKAKKAFVRMPNGKECGVGVMGSYEQCEEYLRNQDFYIGKQATCKFLSFTPDGLLREGILKDINRPD